MCHWICWGDCGRLQGPVFYLCIFHCEFVLRYKNIFAFSITSQHWDGAGVVNASLPTSPYMHQWIMSALVRIMACRLFSTKPLFKTSAGLLSIGPLRRNLSEILIKIQNFSLMKMHLKISSAKWWPFYPVGDELKALSHGWERLLLLAVYTMDADDLATQGARASAAMVSTKYFLNIWNTAPKGLMFRKCHEIWWNPAGCFEKCCPVIKIYIKS